MKATTSLDTSIISSKLMVTVLELSLTLDKRVVVRVMSVHGCSWEESGGCLLLGLFGNLGDILPVFLVDSTCHLADA